MFVVSRTNFEQCVGKIVSDYYLGFDTETTGLHPFLGDRMFSAIIATAEEEYYFNWQTYPNLPGDLLLDDSHKVYLQERLFSDLNKYWFIHKGIFDCPILGVEGMELAGTVHCTVTGERVQYNEYLDFSLEGCGARRKVPKDMSVENYIKKHSLYSRVEINGYTIKKKRFDLVPFTMMTKYGCRDGRVVYDVGMDQIKQIQVRANKMAQNKPTIKDLHNNELRLQKTLHGMQMRGARVNQEYSREAIQHFNEEMQLAETEFKGLTGRDFLLSGKLFAELFVAEKSKWHKTKKGNPSFTEDCLNNLQHPAAAQVTRYKKAKSKVDFFNGFIKFADCDGFIHTELKAYGTRTGRFSSSGPNLQNLEKAKDDDLQKPFVVRRAFIPRDGFFFAMIDYDQIEYRMMLDYARAHGLIDKVLGGLDVHTATAELAGVTRDDAKTVNFGTLYGQGIGSLARSLGVTESRAREIQNNIFNAAPEIKTFIRQVIRTAENRGNIFNWLGRMAYFPKRNFCYKAPNTLIQGGAGDVCKVAMNRVDEFLKPYRSNLLLNIHDELDFEIHYDEAHLLPEIQKIMADVYPHQRLPLTCGIEWSAKSLADKEDFTGVDCVHGKETRDQIQREDLPAVEELANNLGQEVPAGWT